MSSEKKSGKKQDARWGVVLWYIYIHVLGIYATYLMFTSAKWMTGLFTIFITALGCLGITAGAHRLWAHNSYSASGPLKLFLMLAHTLTGVGPIYDWVLYHRLHHKYYGTDKDPFNHKRGFMFSHFMGNCLSPVVDQDQAKIEVDMRDVEQDRYVWFQKILYWPIFIIFGVILPLNAPLEYWDESMTETILITGFLRFAITANVSWLVHSGPLVWGVDKNKEQSDIAVFFITKSYWPWYHYKVPWDWKTDEFGSYENSCTSFFLKLWYELGLIKYKLTVDSADIKDMFHKLANKKITIEEGLRKLNEKSMYNAKKEQLLIRY